MAVTGPAHGRPREDSIPCHVCATSQGALTACQGSAIVYGKLREHRRAGAPSSRSSLHRRTVRALTGPARRVQEDPAPCPCAFGNVAHLACASRRASLASVTATPEGPQEDPSAGW